MKKDVKNGKSANFYKFYRFLLIKNLEYEKIQKILIPFFQRTNDQIKEIKNFKNQ